MPQHPKEITDLKLNQLQVASEKIERLYGFFFSNKKLLRSQRCLGFASNAKFSCTEGIDEGVSSTTSRKRTIQFDKKRLYVEVLLSSRILKHVQCWSPCCSILFVRSKFALSELFQSSVAAGLPTSEFIRRPDEPHPSKARPLDPDIAIYSYRYL